MRSILSTLYMVSGGENKWATSTEIDRVYRDGLDKRRRQYTKMIGSRIAKDGV